jgi:hypothetical protein
MCLVSQLCDGAPHSNATTCASIANLSVLPFKRPFVGFRLTFALNTQPFNGCPAIDLIMAALPVKLQTKLALRNIPHRSVTTQALPLHRVWIEQNTGILLPSPKSRSVPRVCLESEIL